MVFAGIAKQLAEKRRKYIKFKHCLQKNLYLCTLSYNNVKRKMPEISKFFGIIISLYWRDHNPPHIHFTYGEYECTISVLDRVVSGKAPSKVIAKVNEWMDLHEAEILTLWEKAQKGEKLGRIEPLK